MSVIAAYAKINLGLRILGKRSDGYHEIDTVFQTISLADQLSIELTPQDLRLEMIPAGGVFEQQNLAYRAAQMLFAHCGYQGGARIRIRKEIPLAAGLGGASSDAAATLIALNRLLNLKLDHHQLHQLALGLGSDVPFFLLGGLCHGQGRGERLEQLPPALLDRSIVLFKPRKPLTTAAVYREFDRMRSEGSVAPRHPDHSDLDPPFDCTNDLSAAAVQLCPEIRKYQGFLAEHVVDLGGLSGSGPTLYASFAERAAAESFARAATAQLGAWVSIVQPTAVAQRWIEES